MICSEKLSHRGTVKFKPIWPQKNNWESWELGLLAWIFLLDVVFPLTQASWVLGSALGLSRKGQLVEDSCHSYLKLSDIW